MSEYSMSDCSANFSPSVIKIENVSRFLRILEWIIRSLVLRVESYKIDDTIKIYWSYPVTRQ